MNDEAKGIETLGSIASTYINLSLEKIKNLKYHTPKKSIKNLCDDLISFLKKYEPPIDNIDLIDLNQKLLTISDFVNLLSSASIKEKVSWELPLIHECYDICNIDFNKREVFVINSPEINNYGVHYNVAKYLSRILPKSKDYEPIDIFILPPEVEYDMSYISLIGHEIGHSVLLNRGFDDKSIVSHILGYLPKDQDQLSTDDMEMAAKISSYIKEYVCDYIGRVLFSPIFDLALIKSFCSSPTSKTNLGESHPSEYSRIKESFKKIGEYKSENKIINKAFESISKGLEIIHPDNNKIYYQDTIGEDLLKTIQLIATKIYEMIIPKLKPIKNIVDNWERIRKELDASRPPFEEVSDKIPKIFKPIELVVNMSIYFQGNIYKIANEFYKKSKKEEKEKTIIIGNTLIKHMHYVISLYDLINSAYKIRIKKLNMEDSDLSETLWKFRSRITGGQPSPIVIIPTIDPINQYGDNSVDLRLGTTFLIHKPTRYSHIIPFEINGQNPKRQSLDEFYNKYELQVLDEFILHPHQYLLANTLEYISLPYDYFGLVLGRSTWGRLGLSIATATMVQPGYKGCLTLELRNLGETPLPLMVGVRIAQLCVIPIELKDSRFGYFAGSGKYFCPVSAELPKVEEDKDIELLKDLKLTHFRRF